MALTTLKIAVTAPMPKASVRTATTVKVGFLRSMRSPKRRSRKKECMNNLRDAVEREYPLGNGAEPVFVSDRDEMDRPVVLGVPKSLSAHFLKVADAESRLPGLTVVRKAGQH